MNCKSLLNFCCTVIFALVAAVGCGPQTVSVHVQDAETAAPIGNAHVTLAVTEPNLWGKSAQPTDGTTNDHGDAVIKHPDPGRTPTAEVTAPDYLSGGRVLAIGPKVTFDLYHEPGASLRIIVPTGYRGPVTIEFVQGTSFKMSSGTREFSYQFRPGHMLYPQIPQPLIADPRAMKYRVNFADGTPIPLETRAAPAQAVCWRFAAEHEEHGRLRRVFVVGTQGDAFRVQQDEAQRSH